jgi:hypothetical protein
MSKTYISAALRRLVYERSNQACEYCLLPEVAAFVSHEVDHVIAEKHGGLTESDNLALSCSVCNKYKGSDLASIDLISREIIRLYNPRCDSWPDHFQLEAGSMLPLTPIGQVTVQLLQINRPERVEERKLLMQAEMLKIPKVISP